VDFMSDALYHGRRFRTLNVLDEGLREALDIVVDTSLPSGRLVRTLEQLRQWRGLPEAIRCDNGPELCAAPFVTWCEANNVEIRYIQPGKPNQNAFIERFNRTYRDEVLDLYLFDTLEDVQRLTSQWLTTYNEERPHDAHGGLPPGAVRDQLEAEVSTSEVST
jgi:putative transposase